MNSGPGTRWKHRDAEQYALQNPISTVYEQLKLMPPLVCFIAETSVLVYVDTQQSDLLNRACFGRSILPSPSSSLLLPEAGSGQDAFRENAQKETILLELSLEEAFFLSYELKCLYVYSKSIEESAKLENDDLWRVMKILRKGFVQNYKAYSHLRMKNWVVRAGHQYGVDFVAYRHHPAQVHSEYAVIVVPSWSKQTQLSSWSQLQGIVRLCGSVAKILLVLHIIPKSTSVNDTNPKCLEEYIVQEMEIKRWLPEQHREVECISCDNLRDSGNLC
eukprot:c23267_g1_i1 orf=420-1244(-)